MNKLNRLMGTFYWKMNPIFDPSFESNFFQANREQFYTHSVIGIFLFTCIGLLFTALAYVMHMNSSREINTLMTVITYSSYTCIWNYWFYSQASELVAKTKELSISQRKDAVGYGQLGRAITLIIYSTLLMIFAYEGKGMTCWLKPQYDLMFKSLGHSLNFPMLYSHLSVWLPIAELILFFPFFKVVQIGFLKLKPIYLKYESKIEDFFNKLEERFKPKPKANPNAMKPVQPDFRITGHSSKAEKKLEDLL